MKYVDEYRDAELAERLLVRIRSTATRRWTLMEVCGGQTHGLLRHGIDDALADVVEMLHGPGCPVCVTPAEAIDRAIRLAEESNCILASFGDMLRVPGTERSLLQAKSQGADVRVVYSPLDAIKMATSHKDRQVVFFAVGFETTAPATALAVLQAESLGLTNFSVLSVHVRVQPAMESIARAPESRVQGFLAAGHVCTVMGFDTYRHFVQQFRMPVVVTGFEPVDLLQGIFECVRMLEAGEPNVVNAYARSVRLQGNVPAQQMLDEVFEIADRPWRGLGNMPQGGLVLRPRFATFDAFRRFEVAAVERSQHDECRSGDVMTGKIRPPQCPHFGNRCSPDHPLGAPMVSSEGACAAYFAYQVRDIRAGIRSDT
jgi:hydrogenase expression/formation protein HypD